MTYETLKYEVADRILTITLNRPDRLNAFTGQMMLDLIAAFDAADADDEVRAIVVTGEGRGFCAGADLEAGADTFNYDELDRKDRAGGGAVGTPDRDGGGRVTLRMFDCIKPIIGAINGPAVGVGATMQLPMDVRLASDKARFGFVFSQRGICPEACSSWFLPRLVGISQALDWTISGRVFDAAEALAGGLVKEVVPHDQLLARAYELAHEYADRTSAVSVALARQMMWKMLGADHPMEAHKVDSRGIYELGKGNDVKEGVVSFLEKRPPNFTDSPTKDMPSFYPWWDGPEYS
jgi:enoyl-CoA hydratase/carnithine racemase